MDDDNSSEDSQIIVDKWDSGQVKNVLDETAKLVYLQEEKYNESNLLVDIRLFLCSLPVISAVIALIYDYNYPFPESEGVLKACVIAYLLFMAILTLYSNFVETNTILIATKKKRQGKPEKIKLISLMKRYDDMYTLILEKNGKKVASLTKSVGNYFDVNGVFQHDRFYKDVRALSKSKKV